MKYEPSSAQGLALPQGLKLTSTVLRRSQVYQLPGGEIHSQTQRFFWLSRILKADFPAVQKGTYRFPPCLWWKLRPLASLPPRQPIR